MIKYSDIDLLSNSSNKLEKNYFKDVRHAICSREIITFSDTRVDVKLFYCRICHVLDSFNTKAKQ